MKMLEDHQNNMVPLYRSKLWNKVEKSDEKLRKKRYWYKQGGFRLGADDHIRVDYSRGIVTYTNSGAIWSFCERNGGKV